jgi:hypothetical protein
MSWTPVGYGLGATIFALILWGGLFVTQGVLLGRCQDSCDTFLDFERTDPLCIVDPTCVSPLYKVANSNAQNWSGLAYWRLGWEREYPQAAKALALPNYVIFMLLAVAATSFVVHRLTHRRLRRYALLGVFVWVTASAISWFSPSLHPLWPDYAPGHAPLWVETCVITLSLATLAATAGVSRRTARSGGRA